MYILNYDFFIISNVCRSQICVAPGYFVPGHITQPTNYLGQFHHFIISLRLYRGFRDIKFCMAPGQSDNKELKPIKKLSLEIGDLLSLSIPCNDHMFDGSKLLLSHNALVV